MYQYFSEIIKATSAGGLMGLLGLALLVFGAAIFNIMKYSKNIESSNQKTFIIYVCRLIAFIAFLGFLIVIYFIYLKYDNNKEAREEIEKNQPSDKGKKDKTEEKDNQEQPEKTPPLDKGGNTGIQKQSSVEKPSGNSRNTTDGNSQGTRKMSSTSTKSSISVDEKDTILSQRIWINPKVIKLDYTSIYQNEVKVEINDATGKIYLIIRKNDSITFKNDSDEKTFTGSKLVQLIHKYQSTK